MLNLKAGIGIELSVQETKLNQIGYYIKKQQNGYFVVDKNGNKLSGDQDRKKLLERTVATFVGASKIKFIDCLFPENCSDPKEIQSRLKEIENLVNILHKEGELREENYFISSEEKSFSNNSGKFFIHNLQKIDDFSILETWYVSIANNHEYSVNLIKSKLQFIESCYEKYIVENKNKKEISNKIADRVAFLGNKKLSELRILAGYDCETESEALQANKYESRGQLLARIILEEFCDEFSFTSDLEFVGKLSVFLEEIGDLPVAELNKFVVKRASRGEMLSALLKEKSQQVINGNNSSTLKDPSDIFS